MELDPQEFQKRRQEHQQQREQQRQQHRRLILRLVIAGVALIACGAVILTVMFGSDDADTLQESTASTETAATTQTVDPTAPSTTPPDSVIHLAFGGDLNVTQKVVDTAEGDHDYTQALLDVTPVLAQADVTVLNFEGCFFGTPYGADRSAPPALATALKSSGVDMLQLANSYSIYKGMEGLSSSVQTVRDAGMIPLGVYANAAEAEEGTGYTIYRSRGIEIAFVSFTKGMNGMALPAGNENCVNLLYSDYASDYQKINEQGILDILDAVAEEEPDIVVALLHWGSEYNNTISKSQQNICTLLQENGVDAIIGTHSHFVQQMTLDPETGKFVAYSLGDFMGDAPRAGAEYSVILDLEVTKKGDTGVTTITNFSYTPIYNVQETGKPLRLLRIHEAIAAYESGYIDRVSETTYEAMKFALERIDARIKGES